MEQQSNSKEDLFSQDFDVQLSQIVMKIFWLGYLSGKQQLEDDYETQNKPLSSMIQTLQEKASELKGQFKTNEIESTLMNELEKKEREYGKAININHKKINKQHDVIVKQMLDSLEKEMKQVKSEIISKTKKNVVK